MKCNCSQIDQLMKQVQRHEQIIAQLVDIIGRTNQSVLELKSENKDWIQVV